MIVFAAGFAFPRCECLSAIRRAIGRGLHHINDVGVFRIGVRATEIAASEHPWIFGALLPRQTAVIRAKESLTHDRIDALAVCAGSDGYTDAPARIVRQTGFTDLSPGRAFVR